MITKYQAMTIREFHHVSLKNADESPVRCRSNGQCKTWKRNAARFRLPVKYGLREYFYIDNANARDWNEGYGI